MSKMTPGPWELKELVVSTCGEGRTKRNRQMMSLSCYEIWQNQRRICTMVNEANARLIAAAPELYEACKGIEAGLLSIIKEKDYHTISIIIKPLKQLLAKVEGK